MKTEEGEMCYDQNIKKTANPFCFRHRKAGTCAPKCRAAAERLDATIGEPPVFLYPVFGRLWPAGGACRRWANCWKGAASFKYE